MLLAVPIALGSSMLADDLDEAITALMAKRNIPGLSLAIVEDGAIVKAKGYGVVEQGSTTPVTTDTLFQAGSVSKSLAALGALHLVEARKISLDTDVNLTLKTWHIPDNRFTKYRNVTLRRLLSHSAGLTVHGFPGYAADAPLPTLVQVLNGEKPANTRTIRVDLVPGTQWRYSGGGYTVLQQLIIDITGMTFPDFMRAQVLGPLGMQASTYEQPLPADRAALAASGHYPGRPPKPVPGRWHVYPEMAAAGLWTTPSDLARFVIALQDTFAGRSAQVISPAMAAQMLTRQQDNDGLGVFLVGAAETMRFEHDGRDEGFDTEMTAYAKKGQGAVIMINTNENTLAVAQIMKTISEIYGWQDYPRGKPGRPTGDKQAELTGRLKVVLEQLRSGKLRDDYFGAEFVAVITPHLAEIEQNLTTFGALESIALVERGDAGNRLTYRYRVVFKNKTVIARCNYDKDGKIAGLNLQPE